MSDIEKKIRNRECQRQYRERARFERDQNRIIVAENNLLIKDLTYKNMQLQDELYYLQKKLHQCQLGEDDSEEYEEVIEEPPPKRVPPRKTNGGVAIGGEDVQDRFLQIYKQKAEGE